MKIHADPRPARSRSTTAWREGVGHGRRRLVHTILDRGWTEPLPDLRLRDRAPRGRNRSSTRARAPAPLAARLLLPGRAPGVLRPSAEWAEPQQEIGPQLQRLGVGPSDRPPSGDDASAHRLTLGGLHALPRSTEILVTRTELSSPPAAACRLARLRREHALALLVQPERRSNPGRSRSGPFPQSLSADRSRRRHPRTPDPATPRPQIGALIRRRRPTARPPRWRQLLRPRPSCSAERRDGVGADDQAERLTHAAHPCLCRREPHRLPRRTTTRTRPQGSPSAGSSTSRSQAELRRDHDRASRPASASNDRSRTSSPTVLRSAEPPRSGPSSPSEAVRPTSPASA